MRGIGIDVQSVADDAAPARVAREHGDLSVGRDLAAGDPSDDVGLVFDYSMDGRR